MPTTAIVEVEMKYVLVETEGVEGYTKPTIIQKEEWDKMNDNAKALIGLNVSDLVFMNIQNATTAKDLWDKIGLLDEARSLNFFFEIMLPLTIYKT